MSVIVTTTPSLQGYKIKSHIGPVVIPIIGAGSMFKDWKAGFTDTFGGTSSSYKKVFAKLINEGVKEMIVQAGEHGANAILNLKIETTNITAGKSMTAIILYGTAVVAEKQET